jgi:hypothetical protein
VTSNQLSNERDSFAKPGLDCKNAKHGSGSHCCKEAFGIIRRCEGGFLPLGFLNVEKVRGDRTQRRRKVAGVELPPKTANSARRKLPIGQAPA